MIRSAQRYEMWRWGVQLATVVMLLALTTIIIMAQPDGAPANVPVAVTVTKVAESTTVTPADWLAYTVVFSNSSENDIALDVITDVLPSPFMYWGLAVGNDIVGEPDDQDEPAIVWQGPYAVLAKDTLTLRYWVAVPSGTPASDTPYTNMVTAAHDGTSVGPAEAGVTVLINTLVCNGSAVDFDPNMPSDWTVVNNTSGSGVAWGLNSDAACGLANLTGGSGEAACARSGAVAYDTELVSNPINLSTQGAAALDLKAFYKDQTTGGNDRFEVDVWNGSSWTNELSWDEDHEAGDVHLNLWFYRGLSAVQVRFRTYGDGLDGHAQVDDVTLTCNAVGPPAIDVEPAGLGVEQVPDVQTQKQVHVISKGAAPLVWDIKEDDSDCDSPADIAWLNLAPDTGSTLPLDTVPVDVQFDSTGLEPGPYAANLCVRSNDEARPLIVVPVEMMVLGTGISVAKTANPGSAAVGDTIHYTYRVTNTGDIGLSGVVAVDDALGTVPLGTNTLEPKGWTSGVLTYTVGEGDLPGPLVNMVTVTGTPLAGAKVTALDEAVVELIGGGYRVWLPLVARE